MDETYSESYEQITPISAGDGNSSFETEGGGDSLEDVLFSYNIDLSPETASTLAIGTLVLLVVGYVVSAIFLGKVFKKGGVPAWQAWVPILNSWRIFELGGRQGFWAILAMVPILNIVSAIFMIIAIYNINLKLKYGAGMTVVALFFPLIWVIVAGVSKNEWTDSLGAKSLVPSHVATTTQTAPAPESVAAPTPEPVAAPAPVVEQVGTVEGVVTDQGGVEAVATTEEEVEGPVNNDISPNVSVPTESPAENPAEGPAENQ